MDERSSRHVKGYIRMSTSEQIFDLLFQYAQDVRVVSGADEVDGESAAHCFVCGVPEQVWYEQVLHHDALQLAIPYDGVWPPPNSVVVGQKEAQIHFRV